jgi:hypothetical protein
MQVAISHIQTISRLEIVGQIVIGVVDFGSVVETTKIAMVESSTTASQMGMVLLVLLAGVCTASVCTVVRIWNIGDAPHTAIIVTDLISERRLTKIT